MKTKSILIVTAILFAGVLTFCGVSSCTGKANTTKDSTDNKIETENNIKDNQQKSESVTIKEVSNSVSIVQKLTTADFQKKIYDFKASKDWKYIGDKPCIIDFYADWCKPCRMVAPIMDELAKEYAGKIYIYKVDVDKEKELASYFGIQSIPAILFVPLLEQPQMGVGALPKSEYENAIKQVLKIK